MLHFLLNGVSFVKLVAMQKKCIICTRRIWRCFLFLIEWKSCANCFDLCNKIGCEQAKSSRFLNRPWDELGSFNKWAAHWVELESVRALARFYLCMIHINKYYMCHDSHELKINFNVLYITGYKRDSLELVPNGV